MRIRLPLLLNSALLAQLCGCGSAAPIGPLASFVAAVLPDQSTAKCETMFDARWAAEGPLHFCASTIGDSTGFALSGERSRRTLEVGYSMRVPETELVASLSRLRARELNGDTSAYALCDNTASPTGYRREHQGYYYTVSAHESNSRVSVVRTLGVPIDSFRCDPERRDR